MAAQQVKERIECYAKSSGPENAVIQICLCERHGIYGGGSIGLEKLMARSSGSIGLGTPGMSMR